MAKSDWFCHSCAKHNPNELPDECRICMESHVWTKENPPPYFVSKETPSPTLATATNRELLQEVCKRFGVSAYTQYHGLTSIINGTATLEKECDKEYWHAKGSHVLIGRNVIEGPWQDSLIGPEV